MIRGCDALDLTGLQQQDRHRADLLGVPNPAIPISMAGNRLHTLPLAKLVGSMGTVYTAMYALIPSLPPALTRQW
jgi:hypothetical protein